MTTFASHSSTVVLLQLWSDEQGEAETNPDGNECQTDTTIVPTVITTEDDGITEEEGVLCTKMRPLRFY